MNFDIYLRRRRHDGLTLTWSTVDLTAVPLLQQVLEQASRTWQALRDVTVDQTLLCIASPLPVSDKTGMTQKQTGVKKVTEKQTDIRQTH